MTQIIIDCEYNDFRGPLISMALVCRHDDREWYEVVPCENPSPWVAENVMPNLGKGAIPVRAMQHSLQKWLSQFDDVHIIADWPEDIAHFCSALITGPGERINTPHLTFEIIRIDAPSLQPHNALADALGIKYALNKRLSV